METTNLRVYSTVRDACGWVWQPAGSGNPDIPVDVVIVDPQKPNIFMRARFGIFRSDRCGSSWSAFSTGLPRVAVFDLEIANAQRTCAPRRTGAASMRFHYPDSN